MLSCSQTHCYPTDVVKTRFLPNVTSVFQRLGFRLILIRLILPLKVWVRVRTSQDRKRKGKSVYEHWRNWLNRRVTPALCWYIIIHRFFFCYLNSVDHKWQFSACCALSLLFSKLTPQSEIGSRARTNLAKQDSNATLCWQNHPVFFSMRWIRWFTNDDFKLLIRSLLITKLITKKRNRFTNRFEIC